MMPSFLQKDQLHMRQYQGRIQGGDWGVSTPKTHEINFFTIISYSSENNIRDIRPFFRPLCCHRSVMKYTSSLLP